MGELMRPSPRRSALDHLVAVIRWIGVARIVGSACAVLAVAGAAFWLLRTTDPPPPAAATASLPDVTPPTLPAVAEPPSVPTTAGPSTTAGSATVVVHVAGAVVAPGVYELPAGSRVAAGLDAAGGPSADAVLDAINLAAPLADGQQVYVPHTGEASGPAPAAASPGASPATDSNPAPIDVNTASQQELESLPGIGPVTAAAIVRHREESGPFATVDDLLDVPGIGPARLASLAGLIRV